MVSNIIFISENNEYLAVSHSLAGFSFFRLTALIHSEVPSLKQSGNFACLPLHSERYRQNRVYSQVVVLTLAIG